MRVKTRVAWVRRRRAVRDPEPDPVHRMTFNELQIYLEQMRPYFRQLATQRWRPLAPRSAE